MVTVAVSEPGDLMEESVQDHFSNESKSDDKCKYYWKLHVYLNSISRLNSLHYFGQELLFRIRDQRKGLKIV